MSDYKKYVNGEYIDMTEEEIKQLEEAAYVPIEKIRADKISEMSRICNETIENGFDLQMTDGTTEHFSLTTQDQLNLTTLSAMIQSGLQTIPYHADGELCKFYSVEDMKKLIDYGTKFITYQTTYFNSLRNYINSLENADEIKAVEYKMEIPAEYQSDVLKILKGDEKANE